ncbi:MAG: hypothetical protein IT428_05985 [Planctomycetaceae bacterium]|nr:hypothetical protein [Planctomycetaceae bacterium]
MQLDFLLSPLADAAGSVGRRPFKPSLVTLKCVIGPDDDGKPCLTIMLPNQDCDAMDRETKAKRIAYLKDLIRRHESEYPRIVDCVVNGRTIATAQEIKLTCICIISEARAKLAKLDRRYSV